MRKHVRLLLQHQRDILSPAAVQALETGLQAMDEVLAARPDKAKLEQQMAALEKTANRWLKPYPHVAWRENFEVLLVALGVALAIRTFFVQPFKIPTGSMQPTLFGVTSRRLEPDFHPPTGWARVREWFEGISYVHVVAKSDGLLEAIDPPAGPPILKFWQRLVVGGRTYMIWFPPDYGAPPQGTLAARAGLFPGRFFHKGEDIVHLRIQSGDHLFVDRLTYNFRPPDRGEIVVFETRGIPEESRLRYGIPSDQFYIKRLAGLGGETLAIKEDHQVTGVPVLGTVPVGHLVVNGQPLSASTPHFQRLYSYNGASPNQLVLPYIENHYFGHAMLMNLAPDQEFPVEPNHYFVLGDNTMNSLDSRYWGDLAKSYVIGKSLFVYWPITSRFGQGYYR